MPCASAPKAPCVEVWLSPHTIVVPGSVKPCSGPMMWTMPWRLIELVEIFDAEVARVGSASVSTCMRRLGVGDADRAGRRSGTLWSTTASVLVPGAAHLAGRRCRSALEGLRARHLVDEVTVDVEEAGAVGLTVSTMWSSQILSYRVRGPRATSSTMIPSLVGRTALAAGGTGHAPCGSGVEEAEPPTPGPPRRPAVSTRTRCAAAPPGDRSRPGPEPAAARVDGYSAAVTLAFFCLALARFLRLGGELSMRSAIRADFPRRSRR